jgi:NAD(P)H-dependent nitrite reductase small subunit
MGKLLTVAQAGDLPAGQGMCVEIEDLRIALFNVDGTIYAIDDECPHSGAPLSEGDLDGCVVTCPWHNASFDLADGRVLTPPAETGVSTYPVVVEDDQIKLELP